MAEEQTQAASSKTKSDSGSMKLLIIILIVVILIGSSIGVTVLVLNMQSPPAPVATQNPAAAAAAPPQQPATPQAQEIKPAVPIPEPNLSDDAIYYSLDPAFVVNFGGAASENRFLQVSIEVMSHSKDGIEAVKKHMPVIRNNLILLLSSQTYETLSTHEGKEGVRQKALQEVQKILSARTGSPAIEDLYFTGFVMQ